MNKRIERLPTEAMAALSAYSWPGNIRELENLIERAVIVSRGSRLEIPLSELEQVARLAAIIEVPRRLTTLEEAEREHIRQALHEANWQVGGPSGAAVRLGMKRTTLQSKMAKLGIERPARALTVRLFPATDVPYERLIRSCLSCDRNVTTHATASNSTPGVRRLLTRARNLTVTAHGLSPGRHGPP